MCRRCSSSLSVFFFSRSPFRLKCGAIERTNFRIHSPLFTLFFTIAFGVIQMVLNREQTTRWNEPKQMRYEETYRHSHVRCIQWHPVERAVIV